ncbi:MAG TPA: LytR C-terminal domain-containing protein [Solirubrobacteraceae bacterium]|nr:LytR C-terminal domain-containing protein [Solirubrobacteraceae bacterium]
MLTIPFALSVHHFISSVGADAGFAAFIAVALLVLLYFSQARETSNLRRRADEAGHRVQELEAELAGLADQVAALPAEISVRAVGPRATHAYGGVPAPAPAGLAGASGNLPPSAPAGVGAPALAAATRLIPDPVHVVGQSAPATVGLVDRPDDGAVSLQPPPVPAGGNGSSHRPLAASAATVQRAVGTRPGGPSRSAGGPPRGGQGRPPGGQGRAGGAQGRPGGPPRAAMAMRPEGRRTRAGTVLAVFAGLLLIGAVVAGVLVIMNINHGTSASKSSAAAAAQRRALQTRRTTAAAVNPATVTVSVLNGTNTNGLAGDVSTKLRSDGYQKGYVGNFTANQTQTSTAVLYLRGYKRNAAAVATSLKLRPASVQPIDQSTQQLACPPAQGPCKSSVVVTVGSDLASLATPAQ